MIIDSHQHFWKYDPIRDSWIDGTMKTIQRDFLPSDLGPVLKKNNVDGCIAIQADQSEDESNFLLNLAEENNFIKGVVGWVDLCDPNVDQRLAHYSQSPYFKGVRHILQAERPEFMLQDAFLNGIEKLSFFDLTYDILVYSHQLKNSIALVSKFPEQRFVLDHLAKPPIKSGKLGDWKNDIMELAKNTNVYCKLSGMVTEAVLGNWSKEDFRPYMDVVLDAFGTERIMYGSDWPVCLLSGNYTEVLSIVSDYIDQFSVQEQSQIMGVNAYKFYGLNQ
ncbi:amidohydrolase family protein [Allomuricauda sp. F6463D]|uniref:amidohydrolase family protein n=1 Tax=Allomuricauda sp. F6463D TaxID=2926409 RepID=UPI001FF50895|nr:amidohydrolase family protein [Muricauda sp. F6463D]MCK0159187.1 amidohydrolase family protein [Muricauda sp. F6463D]